MSKVLIIGCGGVASVAIHKCCQVPDVFTDICIASRTVTSANIVGADLNELAPTLDTTGVSTATACKVLRELLIALDKGWPGFQV